MEQLRTERILANGGWQQLWFDQQTYLGKPIRFYCLKEDSKTTEGLKNARKAISKVDPLQTSTLTKNTYLYQWWGTLALKESKDVAKVYKEAADRFFNKGYYQKAYIHYKVCLKIFYEYNKKNKYEIAGTYINIAITQTFMSQKDRALDTYKRGLMFSEQNNLLAIIDVIEYNVNALNLGYGGKLCKLQVTKQS